MDMWGGINTTELVWVTPETAPVPVIPWWEVDPLTVPFIRENLPSGFVSSPTAISLPYLVGYDFNHTEIEQLCSILQAHVIESSLSAEDEDGHWYTVDFWESKTHIDDFPEFWRDAHMIYSTSEQEEKWYYYPTPYIGSVLTVASKNIIIPARAGRKYTSIVPPLAAVLLLSSFCLGATAPITSENRKGGGE